MTPRSGRSRPRIVARGQARRAVHLLLAFSVLSGGCASGESTLTPNRPAISDGNARIALGSVGIATTTRSPVLSPHRPETPTSAAKAGAEIGLIPLAWADWKLSTLTQDWEPSQDDTDGTEGGSLAHFVMVLGVAGSLVTGAIGAIYGALQASLLKTPKRRYRI